MTRAGLLVKNWRMATLSSAWSNAEEWWTPAIDAVADAILSATGNPRMACETLGRDRAAAGVFLDEARADVMVAGHVAGLRPVQTAHMVDGLTVGWVDRTLDSFFTTVCVDPTTELATLPYLMTRLGEVYASAAARGIDAADESALVVLQVPASDLLKSELRMVVAQRALRTAFNAGETLARIGPHCAVALVSRAEPGLSMSLGLLRSAIEPPSHDHGRRSRIWIERLAHDRDDLPALIRQLNG